MELSFAIAQYTIVSLIETMEFYRLTFILALDALPN